jgi:carbamoyl-phosphate synthase small subunit
MNSISTNEQSGLCSAPPTNGWKLFLQDGKHFPGRPFGYSGSTTGEVVFNTGMVGYPEALTDPSYRGQILVLTYPLVGNYGVAQTARATSADIGDLGRYESGRIQAAGLIVSEYSVHHSHWSAVKSLSEWLQEERIPALCGVDTRAVTRHLRVHGALLGAISSASIPELHDPNLDNLVSQVSVKSPVHYPGGKKRIVLVDCGVKSNIIRDLLKRGVSVLRVPWNYDFLSESFDGVVISNGPGDPKQCGPTIANIRRAIAAGAPLLGICLGHQLLALAAGADTYKMKFGHRGQNQPCVISGSKRCVITSQNHGYAVDAETLPDGWSSSFTNANDGTNEGLRHESKPFLSVQFHPEATPGPTDSAYLFQEFLGLL